MACRRSRKLSSTSLMRLVSCTLWMSLLATTAGTMLSIVWPFRKRVKTAAVHALAGIHGVTTVDLVATIASRDYVASPISGLRGAALQIELFERHQLSLRQHREVMIATSGSFVGGAEESALGVVVLGDFLLLCGDDGVLVSVNVRRCKIASPTEAVKQPLRKLPSDLVPLFRQAERGGALWFREIALTGGDRVRLRAVVAPSGRVVPTAYRSATAAALETRDDLGAVILDRVG